MQPRQYIIFKWCVYSAVTLLFCLVQICGLRHLRLIGVVPLLYPVLSAMVATFEGRSGGIFFAAGLGALCDVALYPPFVGFFTAAFAAAALLTALIAEFLLTPGFLCGLIAVSITFLLLDVGRVLLYAAGGQDVAAVLSVAGREFLVTLLFLPLVFPVYRWIYKWVSEDY